MNIFYLAGLVIILIGTYVSYIGSSRDSNKTIKDLKDSLNLKNEELQQKQLSLENKQNENNILSGKILDFQGKLDSNTKAIGKVTGEISKISISTNQISNNIKNEQKLKGKLNLRVANVDKFRFILGASTASFFTRKALQSEINLISNSANDPVLKISLKGNEFLITTKIYDSNQNLIVDIKNNQWAIGGDYFSRNFDKNSIELIDNKGVLVFQLSIHEDIIIIKGVLFNSSKIHVLADNITTVIEPNNPELLKIAQNYSSNITRIFNHQGENYLGKRLPVNPYLNLLIENDKKNDLITKKYKRLSNSEIKNLAIQWVENAILFKDSWSKKNPFLSSDEFQNTLVEGREKIIQDLIVENFKDKPFIPYNESDPDLRSKYLEGALISKELDDRNFLPSGNSHTHVLSYPEDYSYRKFCELIEVIEKSIKIMNELALRDQEKELLDKKEIKYKKLNDEQIKNKLVELISNYETFINTSSKQYDKAFQKSRIDLTESTRQRYLEEIDSISIQLKAEYSNIFKDEIYLLIKQLISRKPNLKNEVSYTTGFLLENPTNILGHKDVLSVLKNLLNGF